jgi:hypothetical protein
MQDLSKIAKIEKALGRSIVTLEILMTCYYDEESNRNLIYAKKRFEELERLTDNYQSEMETLSAEEKEVKENQMTNDCESIFAIVAELKDIYFNIFKLITVMIINNKKDSEIDKFQDDVATALKDFKTIAEARDYLFYHSGVILEKFIGDLLEYIKLDNEAVARRLPIKFLEQYRTIITLSVKEWVDIFNNIKFTLKYVGNINKTKYNALMRKYERLEVIYFILMAALDVEALKRAEPALKAASGE